MFRIIFSKNKQNLYFYTEFNYIYYSIISSTDEEYNMMKWRKKHP